MDKTYFRFWNRYYLRILLFVRNEEVQMTDSDTRKKIVMNDRVK